MVEAAGATTFTCVYMWSEDSRCQNRAAIKGGFCPQHCPPAQIEVYRAVIEHFRQDIREFWTRSNFFLVGHAALIAGFAAIATSQAGYNRPVGTALGVMGLFLALFWFRVASSSVHWIDHWQEEVFHVEQAVDARCCFAKSERTAGKIERREGPVRPALRDILARPLWSEFRAQDVAQYLPLLFSAGWLSLVVLAPIFA